MRKIYERKISKAGIALIKNFEGVRLTAYKPVPTETYWTIGIGRQAGHDHNTS
ncbi:UNVERIFIED_CONTAM: GH24 family phage-related lysozyme (muramidase) [Paenibacillus sp. PvR008]